MTALDHSYAHGHGYGDVDTIAVRLRLIGQMEAWTVNSESVLPPGRKTRALLAIRDPHDQPR